jgi:hypothetical protein
LFDQHVDSTVGRVLVDHIGNFSSLSAGGRVLGTAVLGAAPLAGAG